MKNLVRFDLYPTTGDLGVEIEVEGSNLPYPRRYWKREEDGSLRGESAEYVLKRPLSLQGVRAALNYLDDEYEDRQCGIKETVRAGVHVHVNVQQLTITETFNFITLYLVLEEVLVRYCGPEREGNLFCLRACDAEYLIARVAHAANRGSWNELYSDEIRYASINLKALRQYGSVEFRSMRGTRDLDSIYTWASVLLHLRGVAVQYEDPTRILEEFSMSGTEQFVKDCLGEYFPTIVGDVDYCDIVKRGMRNAQEIAYCRDWSTVDVKPEVHF